MVPVIAPPEVVAKLPMPIGLAKLPEASDNSKVNVFPVPAEPVKEAVIVLPEQMFNVPVLEMVGPQKEVTTSGGDTD
jgi:hypothetical protein